MNFIPMAKAGALRNGNGFDRGRVIHAVPQDAGDHRPALCGQQPAIMWSDYTGHAVTCPRCLKKLSVATDSGRAA